MMSRFFSIHRFFAMLIKESIHIRRDRTTFAMMFLLPLIQLILFGYAIDFDPRGLPMAVVITKESPYSRSLIASLEQSTYFHPTHTLTSEAEAEQLMRHGKVQFILSIPSDFSTQLLRREHPTVLLQTDATDPATITPAIAAFQILAPTALQYDLTGPFANLNQSQAPFNAVVHRRYNPEGITQHNIVPGLTGIVLTMTMVMIAAMVMTREFERGTMENLMALPLQPLEVMLGKIAPFVLVGCTQVTIILFIAKILFDVPMLGSISLLYLVAILFILANLSVGFTFSTLATNQVQASQMATFFFLPSLMLSGFAFPFRGMPGWAQTLGELLPLTHFLRIVRGILLKGNTFIEIWPNIWPIFIFFLVAAAIAIKRYRITLD